MFTTLFWNVGGRSLSHRVARLATAHNADLVILAECSCTGWVTRQLNKAVGAPEYFQVGTASRLALFGRFSPEAFSLLDEAPYFTIRELEPIGPRDSLIVAAAHLPSKLEETERGLMADAAALAERIARTEDRVGHQRTLLVGDLNMNPFDFGVFTGGGLHGVMTKDLARKGTRIVRGREYRFFYNPMWRFFGDGTPGPPGTYFYRKAVEECLYWNVFDQALIRPTLLDSFGSDGVEILTHDGLDSLVRHDGRPDADAGSDHLPLLVRLDV